MFAKTARIIYDYWHTNSLMWPSMSDFDERDFFKNTFSKSPHTGTLNAPFELEAEAKSRSNA